jgi:hypothetical protein
MMPYAALPAKSAGGVVTLSDYNTIRTDLLVGIPDIFTATGDLAVAMEAEAATRLAIGPDDATLVADALQLGGMAWQIQPAARIYNSTNLTSVSSWSTLTFDSERFDTDGLHSTVTNTSRLTIPDGGDGLYLIGGNLKFVLSALNGSSYVSRISLRILLNGSTLIARNGTFYTVSAAAVSGVCDIITAYYLVAGDYVELQRYASTSFPYGILNASAYSPEFWAIWQRRS